MTHDVAMTIVNIIIILREFKSTYNSKQHEQDECNLNKN